MALLRQDEHVVDDGPKEPSLGDVSADVQATMDSKNQGLAGEQR